MIDGAGESAIRFEASRTAWFMIAAAAVLALFAFHAGLEHMVAAWFGSEEYSHGALIPLIVAFLLWQRRRDLEHEELRGSWAGVAVVGAGLVLLFVGALATLFVVQQLALLVVIYGLILAAIGTQATRRLWAPLAMLVLMVPLPQFLLQDLSARLQLLSSEIGVALMRLAHVSVFLDGNVIDLGNYKLQVAEACSGLRYLFPLMALGFVMAYLFQAPLWKRLVLFAASAPVTILMNSLRIALIGVTVDRWGIRMAEGFLHDFEGWAMFMASTAVMLAIMIGLNRLGRSRRPWRETFGIDWTAARRKPTPARKRAFSRPLLVSVMALALAALLGPLLPQRAAAAPARLTFAAFPERIGPWQGSRTAMDRVYVDALQFDDYLFADFSRPAARPLNLYVAWYDSQVAGQSAHSPRTCIPGGGWRIEAFEQRVVPGARIHGQGLEVNRAIIAHGAERQLVYYWFQQRGRVETNEFGVKWHILWDALTRNRSDGALVRLVAPLPPAVDVARVDAELAAFTRALLPKLTAYVPD